MFFQRIVPPKKFNFLVFVSFVCLFFTFDLNNDFFQKWQKSYKRNLSYKNINIQRNALSIKIFKMKKKKTYTELPNLAT